MFTATMPAWCAKLERGAGWLKVRNAVFAAPAAKTPALSDCSQRRQKFAGSAHLGRAGEARPQCGKTQPHQRASSRLRSLQTPWEGAQ